MKNNIHFISYGDDNFKQCKARIKKEAIDSRWFKSVRIYDRSDISAFFYQEFNEVLNMPRGGGYWLWKWDVILQRLKEIDENEILVYCDAGCIVNKNGEKRFKEYISMLNSSEESLLAFRLNEPSTKWTTQEIYKAFKTSPDKLKDNNQIMATVLLIQKRKKSFEIFEDCISKVREDPWIITDYYNNNQPKSFIDNRHDQSIFSIALELHGGIILPNECKFPKMPFLIHKEKRG